MSKKLYVGNVSFNVSSEGLKNFFSEAAQDFIEMGTVVSAQIVVDSETGRSRGYGYVEMETSEGAAVAIEKLNDTEFDGRLIKVREDIPIPSSGSGGGRRRW